MTISTKLINDMICFLTIDCLFFTLVCVMTFLISIVSFVFKKSWDRKKRKLFLVISCSLLVINGISGYLFYQYREDYMSRFRYEYNIEIIPTNSTDYYVRLPIPTEHYNGDNSKVLEGNIKFESGGGDFSLERKNGRYLNIYSNQHIILNCSGPTYEVPGPSIHEMEMIDPEMNDTYFLENVGKRYYCYVELEENSVIILMKWHVELYQSECGQELFGEFDQTGHHPFNITKDQVAKLP